MLYGIILFLALTFPVFGTDTSACRVKLAPGDHAAEIYVNHLKWKEPVTKPQKDGIELECKTGFLQHELDDTKEQFVCNKGLYNGTYQFNDLLCRSDFHSLDHIQRITDNRINSNILHCNNSKWIAYEVRRKTSNGEKLIYTVCLDANTMRTKFSFKPSTPNKPVVNFRSREADVWGFDAYGSNSEERMRLSQGYVKKVQKRRTTSSFPEKYNRGREYPYYFNRGHLVAYADFSDYDDQKSTVQYLNAAPQWEDLNKHSWTLVERESRSMLQNSPAEWEIYTGTYGSIPTTRGPLFLVPVFDSAGKFVKGQLPVPLVFWKLVYNIRDRTKSRVFIGVNNPEIRTTKDIGPAYQLCANVIRTNGKQIAGDEYKGFTYECPLDEFLQKLKSEEKIVS